MRMRICLATILAVSVIALAGCGISAPADTAASWSPGSVADAIIIRSASAQNAYGASSYQLTVTASCHTGEQLVGGGYAASNVFEFALFARASYPSSTSAWTVKADSISHYALSVYTYCLHGDPSLRTQVVAGSACPTGAMALSEGQTEHGPALLCAARHVAAASHVMAPITLSATSNGYQPQSARATCPSGALALDGGSTVGLTLASAAGASFASWEVVAGGDGAGEVYANCVTFA
jgi:hypothetical protein